MNLIIDVGNTRVKLALFEHTALKKSVTSSYETINKKVESWLNKNTISNIIISSVGHQNIIDTKVFNDYTNVLYLDHNTGVPFNNNYKSPKTLGVDRIALVSAAAKKYPQENVLVIDAGTCITYDILNKKNEYLGGAISPGINIRFKSLNAYTANLPLLKIDTFPLIGKTTNEAILSGVLNGVVQEIDGVIEQYLKKYPNFNSSFNRR